MKKYLLFFTALFLYISAFSQVDSLNSKLLKIKNQYSAVGFSVAIVKNDSVVFNRGYGLKDIVRNLSTNDSTVYRIASISKFITATALMQLYQQGLFNLDDDISTHLGFTLRNPNFPNDPITIRKVLNHTSSIRDGSGYNTFLSVTGSQNPPPNIKTLLQSGGTYYTSDMFSSSKSPSSNYFVYANVNYGIIGTLIEKLSNQRFDVYCRNNIFLPLGISGSFNIQDIQNINNVAVLYRYSSGNWVAQTDNYGGVKPPARDLSQYILGTNGIIFGPQGNLRISSYDLAKFMIAHMNLGVFNGVRIFVDSIGAIMHNPTWIYNGSNGDNYYGIFNTYGIGCSRTTELLPNETLYGHPGEAYGLISDLYFSKIKDYGIIFMTNGARWGDGAYSGWYNIEEDVYKACLSEINNFITKNNDVIEIGDFNLYQNFPNPFNPSTKIKFSLERKGLVILQVFDVLGKEVSTLVNEEKSPGLYEVEFGKQNTTNLHNGIYFCKLQVDGKSFIRKMILLK